MKRSLQIVTVLLIHQAVIAQIITVKQDSTGDYIHIQDAVDVANNGDTVLAWPGTYYENVVIEEKNITLGSLTLTTGDETYIKRTSIDGKQTGSCVKLRFCPDTNIINGFCLKNGSGTWHGAVSGGGMFIQEAHTKIVNSKVLNNRVTGNAGGIYLKQSYLYLSNTSIANNHAGRSGGGIIIVGALLEFDTTNLCNIYLNYCSESGTDIYAIGIDDTVLHVVVDTFTVIEPDYYYLFSGIGFGYPHNNIIYDINTGKIQQTDENLYVSNAGDNNNNGLTPEEALKDICFALLKMKSDSVSPDTILIANGVYSPGTGEKYPLSLKSQVSLQGKSRNHTILDAENNSYLLHGTVYTDDYCVSKLTLQNGDGNISYRFGGVHLFENHNATYDSILITNNMGLSASSFKVRQSNNIVVRNCEFNHNIGGKALRVGTNNIVPNFADTIKIENCMFIENLPDYSDPELGSGGAIAVSGPGGQYQDSLIGLISNCLFFDNHTKLHPFGGASSISLSVSSGAKVEITNCTFSDNFSDNFIGSNIGVVNGSKSSIYNSILYNNDPGEIYMWTSEGEGDSYLNVYNSLVDGGEENIHIFSDGNNIYYDQTNIDTDPFFLNKWEHPYQIADGSPCIDAGTLDLPDFIELPEFDLAGNPRIVNDSIDMGAYEWNPTVGIDSHQYQPVENEKPKLLKAVPNPFRTETTISANWDFKGHIQIEIYNNAGLRVSIIKSGKSGGKGSIQTKWNGKDKNGNLLPAGIYHIVMFWNGEKVDEIKVVKK